ncbi:hypothetical protein SHIRM173S_06397 [Streptomyces hirsutus]
MSMYGGFGAGGTGMSGAMQESPAPNEHETVGAYALGILDDAEATAFESHLAGCEWCAQQLDELAGMEPMLAALADLPGTGTPSLGESLSAKPAPRVVEKLVDEVAERRAKKRRRNFYMVAAAGALIVSGPFVAVAANGGGDGGSGGGGTRTRALLRRPREGPLRPDPRQVHGHQTGHRGLRDRGSPRRRTGAPASPRRSPTSRAPRSAP